MKSYAAIAAAFAAVLERASDTDAALVPHLLGLLKATTPETEDRLLSFFALLFAFHDDCLAALSAPRV